MTPSLFADFYHLLNLIEDYTEGGIRREHEEPEIASPEEQLAEIAARVARCTRCPLHHTRKHAVPGEGVARPRVLFVGEGPGADEDRSGRPFVGRAGQYLDKWLGAIDLDRKDNCFIANIVKCRPPNNRDPNPEESSACISYLEEQVRVLQPRAIMTLGRVAAQVLLKSSTGIGALRGEVRSYKDIPLVCTYHPSAVLRDPSLRAPVWDDLKLLHSLLSDG